MVGEVSAFGHRPGPAASASSVIAGAQPVAAGACVESPTRYGMSPGRASVGIGPRLRLAPRPARRAGQNMSRSDRPSPRATLYTSPGPPVSKQRQVGLAPRRARQGESRTGSRLPVGTVLSPAPVPARSRAANAGSDEVASAGPARCAVNGAGHDRGQTRPAPDLERRHLRRPPCWPRRAIAAAPDPTPRRGTVSPAP